MFVGGTIDRKTDRALGKEHNVLVCFPGTKIKAITERVWKK